MSTDATPAAADATPVQLISNDVLDAFVTQATAQEESILTYADGLIKDGGQKAADALAAGFKAKVALVGGSFGNAIETAISTMELDADNALKDGYDKVIALAKSRELQPKAETT